MRITRLSVLLFIAPCVHMNGLSFEGQHTHTHTHACTHRHTYTGAHARRHTHAHTHTHTHSHSSCLVCLGLALFASCFFLTCPLGFYLCLPLSCHVFCSVCFTLLLSLARSHIHSFRHIHTHTHV